MSREDGFVVAEVRTTLMADSKIVGLARALRASGADEGDVWTAVGLYVSLILASWGEGRHLTVAEAQPAWSFAAVEGIVSLLAAQGLTDPEGHLTATAWTGWVEAAITRREERRESGRQGGLAKAARRTGVAQVKHSLSTASGSALARARQGIAGQGRDSSTTKEDEATTPVARAREDGANGGDDHDADPSSAYWSLTGRYPNDAARDWLDRLAKEYDPMAVIRHLGARYGEDRSTRTLISRVEDHLRADAHRAEMRTKAERAATHRPAKPPPPDRAAVNRELARIMALTPEQAAVERRAAGADE